MDIEKYEVLNEGNDTSQEEKGMLFALIKIGKSSKEVSQLML